MHYRYVEDDAGDVVDLVPFCCDSCHREWCVENGEDYGGWNGAQEGSDYPEFCANCGTFAGGMAECECQDNNIVVHRFLSADGVTCAHGHFIQLPESYL